MLVEIGHDGHGRGPAVTYARIPDEAYPSPNEADPLSIEQISLHLRQIDASGVTHLPGYEAFLAVSHPGGALAGQNVSRANWVRSTDAKLEELLAAYHGADRGAPDNLEDTHWTKVGGLTLPPGAHPDPAAGITAMLNDGGRDSWALNMFCALGASTLVGDVGTATATTATTLTGGGGATHGTNDCVGQMLVAGNRWGRVASNTSGATPVFTVDQWYNPASPGGAAGSTPGSTSIYVLLPQGPAMQFMGLTTNNTAPALTDTTLASEYAVTGGGLIRKILVLAHTAGVNTVTGTGVFTVNSSDTGLPLTIAKIGISTSISSSVPSGIQTLLSATATLNVSGDQFTATDTVTTS